MTTLSPIALATVRGAAVAFALSAGAFLVYREHARAQPPESVSDPAQPQGEPKPSNPPYNYSVDPSDLFTDPKPADYEVVPGLPLLPQFESYPSDFLFSSKSLPMRVLPAPTFSEGDDALDPLDPNVGNADGLAKPSPTYFPSSKSATGTVLYIPPLPQPKKP